MSESNFARLRRRCSGGEVEERRGSSSAEFVVQVRPFFSFFFSFWFLLLHGLGQRKPYLEPSQSRSPQKPGSGGCKLHVLARDNVDATLSFGLHQKWRALCCLRPRRAWQPWATRAGGCDHCWVGRCNAASHRAMAASTAG